jgi:vacuolar-type H+-ATPase subunit I/STV1
MGLLFGLMTAFIGHRLIFGIILCEINNKELKSTPLSNKNNNTATSVLKISVINSGIKNFFCIDRWSIGLSVLGANFLISFEQYSNDIGKIILHSLMGLLFGLMTAFIGHRLIFGIDLTYLIIYPALFFSGVAVLIAWLYFSRLDNQEALDKIKRKLSAGHKKLHWIKTADSKGNVFLLINLSCSFLET